MIALDTQEIDIHHDICQSWQEMVNLVSEISRIPATLVMRAYPREIEVFIASNTPSNPFKAKDRERLGIGLYCEAVITGKKELVVNDATQDPNWDKNPDIKLGFIAYLGLPICWPNGDIFGTICMLDSQPTQFDNPTKQLLTRFKSNIETDLKHAYQQALSAERNTQLSKELQSSNHSSQTASPLEHQRLFKQKQC